MTRTSKKTITIVAALLSLLLLISPFSPMILYASAATNEMEISISPVDSKGSTVAATSGVVGDNITITLPLVCNGQNISDIIVSPIVSENLDEFPFVIEKLDYTLKKTGTITKGTVCDFQYNFKISSQATAGVKKVGFDVTYTDASNQTQSTVVYLYVTVEESPTVAIPEYTISPKVVVQKFESNKASLTAGTEFELDFTLFNTSVEQNISNLVVKVSDDSGNIVPVNGSSTSMYVGTISKNTTSVVTVPMMVATSATTQNCAITVTLEYEGEDGESHTSTDTIFVSVIGAAAPSEPTYSTTPKVVVQKFESNKASLTAGTKFELGLTLFNTSVEQNISNLVIKVSDENGNVVPANGSSTSMYVGTISKNTTSVVTVPMMVATSATTQNCAITVTLEYEGEDGESYTSIDTIFISVTGATAPSEPTYSTTPKAIIQSVAIKKVVAEEETVTEDNSIYGGDVIELTLVIFNTSAEQNIQNVLLKLNEESNSIIPIDGVVDSSYVGAISKGKATTVSVKMRVLDSAESKTYPLNITMEYEGEDTQSYSVSQSAFITVKESANSQTTPTYSTTPKVIVKTASVNAESIIAGDSFEITLTLRNTSAEQDIHNLVVKLTDESGVIIPVKGSSSSVYAGAISKESEQAIKLVMQTPSTAETKGYSLSVILEYEGDDKQSYTVNDSVVVQINQLPKLTIEKPVLYDTPWLNQTCGTSLSIFNTGRSDIYNCLITIEGEGLTLETSYFGGIIKAGSSLESNFNIIPTKDGEVSGNIVVSYEDAMGNKYEQKCPIELFVNKDYTSTDTPSDVTVDKGGEQNNSWIIVVVIVVVILLCGVLVFVIIKNNRKRRLSDL